MNNPYIITAQSMLSAAISGNPEIFSVTPQVYIGDIPVTEGAFPCFIISPVDECSYDLYTANGQISIKYNELTTEKDTIIPINTFGQKIHAIAVAIQNLPKYDGFFLNYVTRVGEISVSDDPTYAELGSNILIGDIIIEHSISA